MFTFCYLTIDPVTFYKQLTEKDLDHPLGTRVHLSARQHHLAQAQIVENAARHKTRRALSSFNSFMCKPQTLGEVVDNSAS